ncbi:unnamed protein product [Oreochromis niloticus]|nr:unnamed protein product [Mustela putorius furo]
MLDPATQKTGIVRTVESLCNKWLHCSREEEREELARQVGVCVSVFPWLWETLHPLISDFLVSTLRLRPQQQLPGVRDSSPEPCCCIVSPLPREPEAVRVGTVRLTADTPSVHASLASASSPPPDCTTRRTEMPEAIDFGEEEKQQVLRAYREDELRWKPWLISEEELSPAAPPRTGRRELRWKPWLISEEELSPAAPPRTGRPPSPPRSDYSSPASYLARMWSEDEEPIAMQSQVLSTAASKRKRRSRRRRASRRPVSPSAEQHEDAVEGMDFDLEERQRAACAQLEEELRGEPWLAPDYDEIFRGTHLALGGPLSFQELSPTAPSSPSSPASATAPGAHEAPLSGSSEITIKKKRRSRRRRAAQQPEVSEGSFPSPVFVETLGDKDVCTELDSAEFQPSNAPLTKPQTGDFVSKAIMDTSSTPVRTSDAVLRPKETSADHNANSRGSGVEVFSSATYAVPRVPSQTELCVTDASLPVSALLTPEPLQGGNDGVTESLEEVVFGALVQNKDFDVQELIGSQATPSFGDITGEWALEPVIRDCVFSPPGPSAFIANKDVSVVASPELKCEQTECEVTSDKVLPAVVCKELKTIDAGQRPTMKLTDNNMNPDHRNPSNNITQSEICVPLNIKQDVSELYYSSTVTSNQVIMAERGESNETVTELTLSPPRVNVMSVFSDSVNSSLDEQLSLRLLLDARVCQPGTPQHPRCFTPRPLEGPRGPSGRLSPLEGPRGPSGRLSPLEGPRGPSSNPPRQLGVQENRTSPTPRQQEGPRSLSSNLPRQLEGPRSPSSNLPRQLGVQENRTSPTPRQLEGPRSPSSNLPRQLGVQENRTSPTPRQLEGPRSPSSHHLLCHLRLLCRRLVQLWLLLHRLRLVQLQLRLLLRLQQPPLPRLRLVSPSHVRGPPSHVHGPPSHVHDRRLPSRQLAGLLNRNTAAFHVAGPLNS